MQIKKEAIKRFSWMAAIVAALIFAISASNLWACGYGSQGGADYVPHERGSQNQQQTVTKGKPITSSQAKILAKRYTQKVDPKLAVTTPNDDGPYYEVNLVDKNGETVHVLDVNKFSGQISMMN